MLLKYCWSKSLHNAYRKPVVWVLTNEQHHVYWHNLTDVPGWTGRRSASTHRCGTGSRWRNCPSRRWRSTRSPGNEQSARWGCFPIDGRTRCWKLPPAKKSNQFRRCVSTNTDDVKRISSWKLQWHNRNTLCKNVICTELIQNALFVAAFVINIFHLGSDYELQAPAEF